MMSYGQNEELTVEDLSPLVMENSFIGAEPDLQALPQFIDIKDKLPQPVWEDHEDTIACYYKAWQIAFSNLRQPKKGTGFVSPFIDTAFNGCTFMWDSAFMLLFGKYPYSLKHRILGDKGHLSNITAGQWLCRIVNEQPKDRRVLLGHMSRENNTPEVAMQAIRNTLEENGIYIGGALKVDVVLRDTISKIFNV